MVEANNPEISLQLSQQEKITSLREYVTSSEGQEKIVNFVENLRNEVGNQQGYQKACQAADTECQEQPIDEPTIIKINHAFGLFIDQMPPGHDKGHFSRDLLTSIFLYESTKNQSAHQSDAISGLLAGSFHDIGTSIIPRYQDHKYGAGHGETGAYLFWQLSEGLIGENTRKLVCYSIAAHPHYLKTIDVNIPIGYQKKQYWDEIWKDQNDKLVGVAIQNTRRSDRGDTNGITHLVRHLLAMMDAIEAGGQDFSGNGWFEINRDYLIQALNPVISHPIGNPPTTLEHVFKFIKSNDGSNPYSEKDYLFPAFKELLSLKISQVNKLLEVMNSQTPTIPDTPEIQKSIFNFFNKVSKSDSVRFQETWKIFSNVWQSLSPENKTRWIKGFSYSQIAYNQILDFYQTKLSNSEFSNITKSTVEFLRK